MLVDPNDNVVAGPIVNGRVLPRFPHHVYRNEQVVVVELLLAILCTALVQELLFHELLRLLRLHLTIMIVVHLLVQLLYGLIAQTILVLLGAQAERARAVGIGYVVAVEIGSSWCGLC